MPTDVRALAERLVRHRYLLLLLCTVPWALRGLQLHQPHGDWLFAEFGARTLAHHHASLSSGPALHLYENNPAVQMGPPSLLMVVPFEYLPEQLGGHLAALFLSLLVLPSLWCLERAARNARPEATDIAVRLLLAGFVVVPVWTYESQRWGHPDDALALLAMSVACLLLSTGRHELVAGLVLGTAAAAKPWAVVLLPLLLAYPRARVPRAFFGFVGGALVWWAPFVLAAPGTVHALGSFSLQMHNDPTWVLVGLHDAYAPGWVRAVQLLGGVALSTFVVRRAGWTAVPVVALAWRVTTDPYAWPYYVLGPLLGAVLWDIARRPACRWARPPVATVAAFLAESLAQRELHEAAAAVRLAWFAGLIACVIVAARRRDGGSDATGPAGLRSEPVVLVVAPVPVAG